MYNQLSNNMDDPFLAIASLLDSSSEDSSSSSDDSEHSPELQDEDDVSERHHGLEVIKSISRGSTYSALGEINEVLGVSAEFLVQVDGMDLRSWKYAIRTRQYAMCRKRGAKSPYDQEYVVVHCLKQLKPTPLWWIIVWSSRTKAKLLPACQVQPGRLDKVQAEEWCIAVQEGQMALSKLTDKVMKKVSTSAQTNSTSKVSFPFHLPPAQKPIDQFCSVSPLGSYDMCYITYK